jgi:hypothetical protein
MFDDTPPTGPPTAFETIVSPLWLWRLCNVLPKPIGFVVVLRLDGRDGRGSPNGSADHHERGFFKCSRSNVSLSITSPFGPSIFRISQCWRRSKCSALRRLHRLPLGPAAIHRATLPYGTISPVSRGVRDPVD